MATCERFRWVLFTALLGACAAPGSGALDGAASDAGGDATTRCRRNADCDDQLFCNGVELCDPSSPTADARGCTAARSAPCRAMERCDELAAACTTADGGIALGCDEDGDGVLSQACGGADCDDHDPYASPRLRERCDGTLPDGRNAAAHDEDCDPCTVAGARPDGDADNDGYVAARCRNAWAQGGTRAPLGCPAGAVRLVPPGGIPDPTMPEQHNAAGLVLGGDCDDAPGSGASRHPIALELCNGQDDNCDGLGDDADPAASLACGSSADGTPVRCRGAACVLAPCANPARGDCDGNYRNGCETDLQSSLEHCGACGASCGVSDGIAECRAGVCTVTVCSTGHHLCGAPPGASCPADDSLTQCGAGCERCSVTVGVGTPSCTSGACTATCAGVDTHVCPRQCVGGVCPLECVSDSLLASCGSNCAPCAEPSAHGRAVCVRPASGGRYSCATACDAGFHRCGTECLTNDSVASCGSNCGPCPTPSNGVATCVAQACGVQCDDGFYAVGGSCVPGPRPVAPADFAFTTTRQPLLRWAQRASSIGARVELATTPTFAAGTLVATLNATGTSARPSVDLPANRVLFWRLTEQLSGGSYAASPSRWVYRFRTPVTSAGHDTAWGAEPDVDNDGRADLVFANLYVNVFGVLGALDYFLGAAGGFPSTTASRVLSFSGSPLFMPPNIAQGFGGAGDFDGDGTLDLLIQTSTLCAASFTPTFGPLCPALASGNGAVGPTSPAGDFDGDGYADVALLAVRNAGDPLRVAVQPGGPGTATGRFAGLLELPLPGGDLPALVSGVGDLDGDGLADLAVAVAGAPRVQLLYGRTASTTSPRTQTLSLTGAPSIGALGPLGDFDHDGFGDLLLLAGGQVLWFRGSSAGVPATPTRALTPPTGLNFTSLNGAGDVNADGFDDLLLGVRPPTGTAGAGYAVFHGSATGPSWSGRTLSADPTMSAAAIVGDLNADGFADVALGQGGVSLYAGSASGVSVTSSWGGMSTAPGPYTFLVR